MRVSLENGEIKISVNQDEGAQAKNDVEITKNGVDETIVSTPVEGDDLADLKEAETELSESETAIESMIVYSDYVRKLKSENALTEERIAAVSNNVTLVTARWKERQDMSCRPSYESYGSKEHDIQEHILDVTTAIVQRMIDVLESQPKAITAIRSADLRNKLS